MKAYTSSCHKAIAVHRDAQGPRVRAVIAHWFDGPGEHDSVFAGLNLFQSIGRNLPFRPSIRVTANLVFKELSIAYGDQPKRGWVRKGWKFSALCDGFCNHSPRD